MKAIQVQASTFAQCTDTHGFLKGCNHRRSAAVDQKITGPSLEVRAVRYHCCYLKFHTYQLLKNCSKHIFVSCSSAKKKSDVSYT